MNDRYHTRGQLMTTMSPEQLNTAVRKRKLFRLAQGIYSAEPPTEELRLRALHEVRGLVYTGQTAMALYMGEPVDWPVEARHTGPGRRTAQARIRSGVPERLRSGKGLSLVSPLQAVMDAAASAEFSDQHREFLTEAYRGIAAHDALERDIAALVTGRARARDLLAGTPTGTASRLEQQAFHIIREALADLPVTVLTNRMVGNYCYDLVVPEAKMAVEIDSFTFHALGGVRTTERSFVKQVWKDNEAVHLGWVVQHYTEFCVRQAPERVAADVRRTALPRISRVAVAIPDAEDDAVFTWHPVFRPEVWHPSSLSTDPAN